MTDTGSIYLRFAVVGMLNTGIGLGIIFFLKWIGGIGDAAANVAGYGAGLTAGFLLNRNWTFAHSGDCITAAGRFLAVFGVAYCANLGTVLVLVNQFGISGYVAQTIGVMPYAVLGYLGNRYFAFKSDSSGSSEK